MMQEKKRETTYHAVTITGGLMQEDQTKKKGRDIICLVLLDIHTSKE